MLRDIQVKTTSGSKFYFATKLRGGGAGALDDIDGATLYDHDIALVVDPNFGIIWFKYDQDSGATDDGLSIIAPDTNAVNGRWILITWHACNAHMNHDTSYPRRVIGAVS